MPQGCRKTDALRRWLFGFSGSPMAPWGGGSVVGGPGPGCPGPWLLGCYEHADRRARLLRSETRSGSRVALSRALGSGSGVAARCAGSCIGCEAADTGARQGSVVDCVRSTGAQEVAEGCAGGAGVGSHGIGPWLLVVWLLPQG